MHTFVRQPNVTQQTSSAKSTIPDLTHENPILHLQRAIGNKAVLRMLAGQRVAVSAAPSSAIHRTPQDQELDLGKDWRAQARKSAPWKEWTDTQKELALSDYHIARRGELKRIMDPNARKDTDQEAADQEVLSLLEPYKENIQKYDLSHTYLLLTSDPFQESSRKQILTLTATVIMRGTGKSPTDGDVIFNVVTGGTFRVNLGRVPLVNGVASLSTALLPKGRVVVGAEYVPYKADLIGSSNELVHEVK